MPWAGDWAARSLLVWGEASRCIHPPCPSSGPASVLQSMGTGGRECTRQEIDLQDFNQNKRTVSASCAVLAQRSPRPKALDGAPLDRPPTQPVFCTQFTPFLDRLLPLDERFQRCPTAY